MKSGFIFVALSASAYAATLQTRADPKVLTIDPTGATCGTQSGGKYGCSGDANCCSQFGSCGSSLAYCGYGCQDPFSEGCMKNTGFKPENAVTKIDPTGKARCGKIDGKEYGCTGTDNCCSKYGYCGSTFEHCDVGCKEPFSQGCYSNSKPLTYKRKKSPNAPYGSWIQKCKKPGHVAFTLSTGPSPKTTTKALDVFDRYKVKGTFFVEGDNGSGRIDSQIKRMVVSRMVASKHEIGLMSWDHVDFDHVTPRQLQAQVTHLETALTSVKAFSPEQCNKLIRPPQLSCTGKCLELLTDLGYLLVGGDTDPQDWKYQENIEESKKILTAAVKNYNSTKDSYLVLLTDVYDVTVTNLLPFAIELFQKKGLKVVTVSECLGLDKTPAKMRRN